MLILNWNIVHEPNSSDIHTYEKVLQQKDQYAEPSSKAVPFTHTKIHIIALKWIGMTASYSNCITIYSVLFFYF